MLTVNDLLNRKGRAVWSVTPQTLISETIAKLAEKNIGAILVMDGDKLVGIFSERDYVRDLVKKQDFSLNSKIEDFMITDVLTVSAETSVLDCMNIMTEKHFRHLPVLQGSTVVGVVTIGDVVNSVIHNQKKLINDLEHYIYGGEYVSA